jgi:DNA repair protein RadD
VTPLWDFQAAACWAIREMFSAWRARPVPGGGLLLQSPTGSGKTRMAIEIVAWARAWGLRALFLAPRDELIKQTVASLTRYGLAPLCVVRKGRVEGDPGAGVVVASIQTLVARSFCPDADLLVLDEARHYVASEWRKIAGAYRGALRLLLDATPARADGAPLGDLAEELLVAATVAELQTLWVRTCGTQGLCPITHLSPAAYQEELSA